MFDRIFTSREPQQIKNHVPASCCNIYSNYACYTNVPPNLDYKKSRLKASKLPKVSSKSQKQPANETDIFGNNFNKVGCAERYAYFYGDNANMTICFLGVIYACMTLQYFLFRIYRLSIHTAMIMGHTHMLGYGWLFGPTIKGLPINHLIQRATQTSATVKVTLMDTNAPRLNPMLVSRKLRGLKIVVNSQMIYCIAGDQYVVWALNKPKPEVIKNNNFVQQPKIQSTINDDMETQSLAAVSEFS